MKFTESLFEKLDQSGMMPGSKQLVMEFFSDYGDLLNEIGSEALQELLVKIIVPRTMMEDSFLAQARPKSLVGMLREVEKEMGVSVVRRVKKMDQLDRLGDAMRELGMQLLARLLLAAI